MYTKLKSCPLVLEQDQCAFTIQRKDYSEENGGTGIPLRERGTQIEIKRALIKNCS